MKYLWHGVSKHGRLIGYVHEEIFDCSYKYNTEKLMFLCVNNEQFSMFENNLFEIKEVEKDSFVLNITFSLSAS